MSKQITTLQDSVAQYADSTAASAAPYLIYLISSRLDGSSAIGLALRDAGYHVRYLQAVDDAHSATTLVDAQPPKLVLLDLVDAHGLESDSQPIQSARQAFPALPILVIGKTDTLETRLAAFRAGACRYFCEPLVAERLLAILDTISIPQPQHVFRILLVDDDAAELAQQSQVLRAADMDVQTLDDPMQILTALDSFQPDVLILAIQLQGVSGTELAAIVREREDALQLPILFIISNNTEQQQQLRALNLGGDGILLRPVQNWQLIATVTAKARRTRYNSMLWQRLSNSLRERQREQLALNQHAIVSVADRHGNISYVNDKFCAISGYSRAELLGQNHRIVKSGLHDAEFYRGIWRSIASGQIWQGNICNRRKDGSLYWVESTITPFLDAQGKPYQYVSIRTDISHVKAAEAAMRRQRDMHRIASEAAAMLMIAPKHDLDFAIEQALKFSGEQLGADRAYVFLFSHDGQQMSNTHAWSAPWVKSERDSIQNQADSMLPWWHEQIQKRGMVIVDDVAALPEIASAERACFEQQAIQSLFAAPIQHMGKTCGFIGYDAIRDKHKWNAEEIELLSFMADVIGATLARQHAEQSIALHQERLRHGQIYASIGTWEWHIQTEELFWSERIAPLFGYPQGDLKTSYENFLAAVHPDDRQAVQDAIQACIAQDIPYEIEHRVVWPDGTVRWLLERGGVVRDSQGKPLQMIGVVQDIDARKSAELALISAREEADRANRAKSDFLSSMSHELRTPMNAILGFGQLMEYDDTLPEEQRDNVQEILKAGKHLLELINEVLDLAKVESGHIDLSIEPVELCPVVEECLSLIQNHANKRQIRISHTGIEGVQLRADRTRLKQVLLNLLSNAVKYNREGGRIDLSVEHPSEDFVRIQVADTGPGIAPERLEELFQPFNRLDAKNTEVEGSGIGLTITRRIVEMMGGSIQVESTPGKGSRFWIELPYEADTAGDQQTAKALDSTPAMRREDTLATQQTVLYIEDNPSNIKLVAQLLARRKHIHLLTAHLPELGIKLARSRHPVLILLDINMPGLNGYEVLNIIRGDPALKDTPVIAITANAMPADIERGKAAGFDAYLSKPLDVASFYKLVDDYLLA